MGIIVKGGSTKVIGQGRVDIGPKIPTNGLVMIIDPSLAQTTSSAYPLITPLTSSLLTATTSNISPGAAGALATVGLITRAYPTGANSFVYANTGSTPTITTIDARNTFIDVQGDALRYLQNNVQNNLTILYWYSGFCPGVSYPQVFSDATPYYKFSMLLNPSPSPVFPVRSSLATSLPSAQMGFGPSVYAGASTYRLWAASGLNTTPFPNTGSMTKTETISIPSTVSWGVGNPAPLQTGSNTPSYTGHSATPNPPAFHRGLQMSSFAGREVYRDNDTWNCFALTVQQTDKTVTSSVFLNGGLFGTATYITSSITTGKVSGGSTNLGSYNITNNNLDTFYFTGSIISTIGAGARIQIIPTSSGTFTDTVGFPSSTRTYYFSSGSTIGATLQNLVDKINNTTGLSTFFTASLNSTTVNISSSVVGTQFNSTVTFNFSSSAQATNTTLFTFAGGTLNAGSGPITTTLLQSDPSASALRVGVTEVPAIVSGFYRNGLAGLLGATYIYNRILSQDEIIQFYNALKSKYGNTALGNTPKNTYRLFNPAVSGSGALGIYEDPVSSSGVGY